MRHGLSLALAVGLGRVFALADLGALALNGVDTVVRLGAPTWSLLWYALSTLPVLVEDHGERRGSVRAILWITVYEAGGLGFAFALVEFARLDMTLLWQMLLLGLTLIPLGIFLALEHRH